MKKSLFLVSAAVISYQLLLIQNLSVTQWYHFASMMISVALLGFGASGTFLTLFKSRIMVKKDFYYFLFLFLTSLMMIGCFRLTQMEAFAFDSFLVFNSWSDMSKLFVTYLLLFLPFFFAAAAIGLLFMSQPDKIGNLYFINLTGSATGGLIILFILNYLTPQSAIAVIALFPVAATIISLPQKNTGLPAGAKTFSTPNLYLLLTVILIISAIINLLNPPNIYLSEFKSLSKVMNMPESEIIAEVSSPYGLVQAVESPYVRYAPGLSLMYTEESGIDRIIFNNGNWIGPILKSTPEVGFYDYSTLSLPHVIQQNDHVLVLEAGSGEGIKLSLQNNASSVTAVESNAALIDFLKNNVGEKSVFNHANVKTIKQDPYAYLLTSADQYDLIQLPLYDAFGGSSGIGAIAEKPLLAIESFRRMWDSLGEDGLITISTWIDTPLRSPLRLMASMNELLDLKGVEDNSEHLIAIRNWSLITFVVSKDPFTRQKITRVRDFSDEFGFDILLMPDIQAHERETHHLLSDKSLLNLSDLILEGSNREDLYRQYPFKISPVNEDRPFPFQFFKLSRIKEMMTQFTIYELPYLEIGYFLVLTTFVIVVTLAALFILLPLTIASKTGSGKLKTFLYFFALGLGFLMVEIVLIQRFISYLGTPLYSSSVIISSVLLFSGLGSNVSGKLKTKWLKPINRNSQEGELNNQVFVLISIVSLIIIYALFLHSVLHLSVSLSFPVKVILAMVFIAPLAFLMGFPFPLGIKHLYRTGNAANISWAWAINGSMSVTSSVLAVIIAVEWGFTAVKLIAAGCYFLALIAVLFLKD